ncbi:cob(I)yrinic acid a,c-diamide adenosyltransferase [Caldanaerobacter subterraneus]|uniref:Cob(I)yrinic acid a,c-diamide adenosyltransferase n=1 Tax=Caldanaerobacter subterraneus TaxID=911092 RepID=A0A7Y2L7F2_9THEO|nr:cob(I)yrinic acid a,c-diamide adenosyltransferase [Caldanaerobacter subterraneus]NNG66995.1 cob(I)yrinic acid a,c-diamide adenosyltransferase [Caldanaerobacter subterraneus]
MKKGYVQVYTGDGKGKTTAALGLAFRAVGRGMKVIMFQFLKGMATGELKSAELLKPNFEIKRFAESKKFTWEMTEEELQELKSKVREEYEELLRILKSGEYDIVIVDEAMAAIHSGLLSVEDVLRLIEEKPESVELILTGRSAPQEIIEKADLVTEMKEIKHYYKKGVPARVGIEI